MNADEIVRALRNCKAYKTKSDLQTTMLMAADCIEALQAQLAEMRKDCDITDAANAALHGALEEAKRKTDMAVADIKCADHCDVCMHKDSGTSCERVDFDCAECDDPVCICRCCRNNDKWEWRGNAE